MLTILYPVFCLNAFIVYGFLPSDLTDTVLVHVVKDKTGDISDKGNYRPIIIALASVISRNGTASQAGKVFVFI